ncbi:alpha/beta hydrolase [Pyxidicoccus caerfyrddinensis]|jgi:alpha-beta hydrolase superfamily lysophospholipase|uniref:alpha/beta hydrolase n=1 Tax=Pyxidicoccus caerfyrddinensis TaxID=2709663 RepID=UPI0013D9F105|nr:alpha/beta hydrolase [Pyxidicoccus caerfyrddinensis]
MARHDEGFFNGRDGTRLFWKSSLPDGEPRAHVAVVHGYGDHFGRYGYVADALLADGFAVHGFDYRGHGRADGRRGYSEAWPHFVDDLETFWERVRKDAGGKKTFMLAHSHGGLMAVKWMGERKVEGLSGVVLSAPYLKLAITPPALKLLAARAVGRLVPWLPLKTELTVEALSKDLEVQRATREDPLYLTVVTPRWFLESTKAQAEAMLLAPKIQAPLFVLCGAEDGVAAPAAARVFFEAAGAADKKFKEYPGMRHEPLNEVGRAEVFRDISGWISAHL